MQRFSIGAVVATLIFGLSVVASGDDGSWKMPNLNPFAGNGKAGNAPASRPPTSGWHMPKLWPKATATRRRANEPSAWNKMTSGTRKAISKTADALNPWDDKQPKRQQNITGSNTAFTHNKPAKTEPASGSILPASWWTTDKSEKSNQPPKSVNDFLSQPRPQ